MADLQDALRDRIVGDDAIAALMGDRAYWSTVPQGASLPYLRMQTISDPRPQHMKAYHKPRTIRVQIDVFSSRYAEARQISEAIIALVAKPATVDGVRFGRTRATGPRDLGEDTPNGFIHRLSMDLLAEHTII